MRSTTDYTVTAYASAAAGSRPPTPDTGRDVVSVLYFVSLYLVSIGWSLSATTMKKR